MYSWLLILWKVHFKKEVEMMIITLAIFIKIIELLTGERAHEAVISFIFESFYFVCLQATSSVCRQLLKIKDANSTVWRE